MRILVSSLAAVLLLSGCITAPRQPSSTEVSSADYGDEISQENAERLAVDIIKATLKDPDTAKFNFSTIQKGWAKVRTNRLNIGSGRTYYGYQLDGSVNAKNSYGGYVGYKPFTMIFRGEELQVYLSQETGQYGTYMDTKYYKP